MFSGEKGFTILEIVIGVSIFLVGMLGVAAMEISAIRAEAFSIRLTEATLMARSTFEEMMTLSYSDTKLDDDDLSGVTAAVPDFANDGDMNTDKNLDADSSGSPDAFDNADSTDTGESLTGVGTNGNFNIGWSVCEDCLIEDTKSVRVIVYWRIKDRFQSVDFHGLIPRK
jgi:type II secretory pathway pseudopilin PulG